MDILLLHGGFHGGWCWRETAATLASHGHRVLTPSFTGSGERAHLIAPRTGLYSAVQDVLAVIETEDLRNVAIVGHSLAGGPMLAVADALGADRIALLLYLDAILLADGESVLDAMPSEVAEARRRMAEQSGTNSLAPVPAAAFGLTDPEQIAWVESRLTPQAFASFTERLVLRNPPGNGIAQTYILCTRPPYPSVARSAAWAQAQPDWSFVEFEACHDAMIEKPRELAALLHGLLERSRPTHRQP